MSEPVFIIYPETYAILKEHGGERREWDQEGRNRIVGILASWEAALQTYGDRLAKVVLHYENDNLTFDAFETNQWRGELGGTDE